MNKTILNTLESPYRMTVLSKRISTTSQSQPNACHPGYSEHSIQETRPQCSLYTRVQFAPCWNIHLRYGHQLPKAIFRSQKKCSSHSSARLEGSAETTTQQRRQRCIAIQIWKILEGLSPNLNESGGIQLQHGIPHRRGREFQIVNLARTPSHLQQTRKQSFKCVGAKIFNELPIDIRNTTHTSVDNYKSKLDKHYGRSSDTPHLRHAQTRQNETHHYHHLPHTQSHVATQSHTLANLITGHNTASAQIFPGGSNQLPRGGRIARSSPPW